MNQKFKIALSVAAVSAALAAQSFAAGVDFHGYLRSGAGSSSKGGKQVCFQLDGAPSKYRLGNECETYGELAFDADLYKSAQGSAYFKLHTMAAFSVPADGDWEQADPSWRQTWTEVGGFGEGALATAKIWAGKRYYKRNDVHLNDFFYWNNSGPGGGIEDIDLGFGKFSYAYIRRADSKNSKISQTTHDMRLEAIGLGTAGTLDLGLNFGSKNNVDNNGDGNKNGTSVTVQHNLPLGDSWNKFIVQYANKNIELDGSSYPGANDKSKWRVLDRFFFNVGNLDGEGLLGYTKVKDGDRWFTAGVRPVYHFNELFSLASEVGYDRVKPNAGDTRNLWKVTIAPQISAGKSYWSRPTIRAFVTYAKWNKEGVAGGDVFKDKTNGTSYGIQTEAWW
ncbi:carbohydrate porin [Chitinivorax sp. B]|uniref:maltoporin n=1 Tax=Chitinivorax sp. B TaxID=2502235 RepID=UPI0010F5F988|nr:carbohydrate porin [Chitinivorax sp. B]